jgi:hypothetical protein
MARHAVLVVLLVLAACSKDEEKELAKARSWSATAMLVAGHWMRGEVPSAYARDALKKAADELAQGAFPEAAVPVADLGIAVAREDRAAARRLLDELGR